MMRSFVMFGAILSLFTFCSIVGVACSASQKQAIDQAGNVGKAACTVLTATTADDTVHTVCATFDEIADIVGAIRVARVDAGKPGMTTSRCHIIPTTTFCATDAELAPQIARLAAKAPTR
jgi:hypothetical protein